MAKLLDGHVAVVSGAESGIGRAIALLFASEGARVVGTYLRDKSAADKLAGDIQDAGGTAQFVQTDVSDETQVDALFDHCLKEFGKPTLLINDAGINQAGIRVCDMSLERWLAVLSVNLTGPFLMCRRFARELQGQNARGKIINITSVHEDLAVAGAAEYCASKGGLRNLTRCLALELAPQKINVNNIAPGMILTPMNEKALEDPAVLESSTEHVPLRRAGTPEEVARLALFLARPESDYATGSTFFLDGGLMLNLGQGA